ncbi:thymidylate synthase [Pseudophaeobacter flagellatus]|uniref:thymidylate synthase n=1 Tax=Pseudophaeobacter flagellatus TaxID=2899119 RepID=UPI001E4C7082|nr:thymidylate synthase [Pseudophaeobacter flagellatus]MCD9147463.1 thymidylate synthase [Pseudophaeobacter flagellatus]
MRAVFKQLLTGRGNFEVASSKGKSTETFGALLELKNPRARLSRSFSRARAFSPLGEFFWYLAGSDSVEFIKHYIPNYPKLIKDDVTASGAYGPRIFGNKALEKRDGISEWDRVIRTLREREGSRNALIQIYANSDARPKNGDKPCTCTIQFAVRNGQLLMHTHMRSNDAFFGLPHDIFTFTMLQEVAARELGFGLGKYTHSVTSLHLYHDCAETEGRPANTSTSGAEAYYREGFHDFSPMPEMPSGDPWPSIETVKMAEQQIRSGNIEYTAPTDLEPYWHDFIELFRIHKIFEEIKKRGYSLRTERPELRRVVKIMKDISPTYRIYILGRLERKQAPVRDLFENVG